MESGKLPPDLLERLLRDLRSDPRVALGPGTGHDAAAIEMGDRYLVVSADPVSFARERSGWYAVQISANDIVCLGAEPRWFLATVLLPRETEEPTVTALFDDIRQACDELGVALIGGHTEVTPAVRQPIIAGTMIGEALREGLRRSDAAQAGDRLIQIGPVAIEGTALLAREAAPRLHAAGLTQAEIDSAAGLLFDPGISVLPAAQAACALPGVHSLHDPTEGGISTACWELAQAAGLGVVVERSAILVHPLTETVCTALQMDALGMLASGALLVSVAAADAASDVQRLCAGGVAAAAIGQLSRAGEPAILNSDRGARPLPRFPRDEVARVLAQKT